MGHTLLNSFTRLGITVCSTVATGLAAIPAVAADTIIFSYPPFGEFSLSVQSLETFAKQGKITRDFAYYAKFLNSSQQKQLRELLQNRFEVNHTLVSQFTYSPLGEASVRRLGELLQTETRDNGFQALRAALILAAADKEGLTFPNLLRQFPSRKIRVNLKQGMKNLNELSELIKKRDAIVAAIRQTARTEAEQGTGTSSQQYKQFNLKLPGELRWQKQTIELHDPQRDRHFLADLYLPDLDATAQPLPVVVISHGIASDRNTFAYLAEHLASYGFAVAVLEHPGSNSQKFQRFFAGLEGPPKPTEFLDRPLDVTYLLDELQRRSQAEPFWRDRLNLQQVGVIGHSFGGYTALVLAGATIDAQTLKRNCSPNQSLNISMLLQCRASDLPAEKPTLRDTRVKSIIAINPLDSSVLGRSGLSQIQVPVMMVGGSDDIVTPTVPEQIRPFTWLTTPDKYLVVVEKATHFSTTGGIGSGSGVLPVPAGMMGPEPQTVRGYMQALSVAFLKTHLGNHSEYRSYLNMSYIQSINQSSLNISLVKSLNPALLDIEKVVN